MEKRCDGKIDCWDATDEINCTLGEHPGVLSQRRCDDSSCVELPDEQLLRHVVAYGVVVSFFEGYGVIANRSAVYIT